MTDELRDAAEVERWLALGLAVRRIVPDAATGGPPEASDDELVGDALRACANELPALPPPGVVADIATLLTGARPVARAADAGGEALRAALRAYDDDVLVRLRGATRFDDVLAAYAHAAPDERPAAAALVVGAVCERARFVGVAVSPAALRRALARLRTPGGSGPGLPRDGPAVRPCASSRARSRSSSASVSGSESTTWTSTTSRSPRCAASARATSSAAPEAGERSVPQMIDMPTTGTRNGG